MAENPALVPYVMWMIVLAWFSLLLVAGIITFCYVYLESRRIPPWWVQTLGAIPCQVFISAAESLASVGATLAPASKVIEQAPALGATMRAFVGR